jgi:heme exporter protein D
MSIWLHVHGLNAHSQGVNWYEKRQTSQETSESSLADTLYGDYKWVFRAVGLISLIIAIVFYLRRSKGICTLDEAKKRRQEIINIILITLIAGVLGYIFFLYVVVHYIGVFVGVWADYF